MPADAVQSVIGVQPTTYMCLLHTIFHNKTIKNNDEF